VQSGSRRRSRACVPRIHRLIALGVGIARSARNVRRQRHVAVPLEIVVERVDAREMQPEETSLTRDDRCARATWQEQHATRVRRMACAKLKDRFILPERALEQQLDLPACGPLRNQSRLHDARVVEYQQITACEEPRKIDESKVVECRAADVQKPAAGALGSRRLRNQFGRQRVIEIGQREMQ